MDTDTDKDMDMETDMDMDLELEWEFCCKISIQSYSPYSTKGTTWDTPRSKFQGRYKLVAPLPDENYSYRCLICSPKDVLAELEMSVWG